MEIFYKFFKLVYENRTNLISLQNELLANELKFKEVNSELFYLLISAESIGNMKKIFSNFQKEYKKWLFCKLCSEILMEETPRIYDILWELVCVFGKDRLTNKIEYLYSTLDCVPLEQNKKQWKEKEYNVKRKNVLKISEEIKAEIKILKTKYC